MKSRYVVRPCDDGQEFAESNGRARARSWDVCDTYTAQRPAMVRGEIAPANVVANFDKRTQARDYARDENAKWADELTQNAAGRIE